MAKPDQDPWSRDPFAEAVWGSSHPDINQPDENSPRSIRLPLTDDASSDFYVFEDRNRIVFPRKWLAGHAKLSQRMGPDSLRKLVRMVLRRYDRQPRPSEFDVRINKQWKNISKLLRHNEEHNNGIAIYLRLNTWDELEGSRSGEEYQVFPVAVYQVERKDSNGKKDQAKEDDRKQAADDIMKGDEGEEDRKSFLALGLVGLLKKCQGIRVVGHEDPQLPLPFRGSGYVVSESQFTLDHRHEFRPWEFDHLSPNEKDSVPLSPHSI
jgi:hypothetical protein